MTAPITPAPSPPAPATSRVEIDRTGLERGDDCSIEQAFAVLERGLGPQDFLTLVRSVVGLGLGGLASSLLRTIGAPLLADPAMQALANQLERLPSGEIPLAEQRVFAERNVAAIKSAIAEGIHDLGDWTLDGALLDDPRPAPLRDRHGRIQLLARPEGGPLRLLSPFRLLLPGPWREQFGQAWPPFATMSGVPAPHLVAELLAGKRAGHLPAKVMVFETDLLALRTWLRSADISESLASGAIELRCGPRGVEGYLAEIDRSLATPPTRCVLVSRGEPLLSQSARDISPRSAERWTGLRGRLESAARERIAAFGSARRAERMRGAASGSTRLVIAGFVSRHTTVVCHMMRDLMCVFRQLGHETILMSEPTSTSPMVDLLGPLSSRDVDLVLAINYLRNHPVPLMPAPIPFACWMQDLIGTAQTKEAAATQGPWDLLVAPSIGFFSHRFGYRADQGISAPNLTSWAMYGRIGDTPRRGGAPDVVYVGHGWEEAETLVERQGATPEAREILGSITRTLRERLHRGDEVTGFERMRIIAAAVGTPVRSGAGNELYWAVQTIFDRLFRHQALAWAARWCERNGRTFAIYGNGWESHPKLGRFARGTVANGPALGELCRDAGVVLHANGNASLHQRLLDGIAAGGCVLTRRNPADEVSTHWRTIRERAAGASMAQLHQLAAEDSELARAVHGFERTLGCSLALSGNGRRDADRQVISRIDFWPPETTSDDGLASHLTSDTGFLTPHGAADIDGFQRSTYANESELGDLLQRVLDDPRERDAIRLPMRDGVHRSFTMEWLAGSILERMATMLETSS
ncbi:MAG: hypothetical protein JNL80_02185 [Phycisphaerae bacterium]|nr:hypothetical protein [Phycisphaerae bacterium]